MKFRTIALFLTLAAVSFPAFADRYMPDNEGSMIIRPTGNIGYVAQHRFDRLDANRDGRLSPEEASKASMSDVFWVRDINRDGTLSRQEFDRLPNEH